MPKAPVLILVFTGINTGFLRKRQKAMDNLTMDNGRWTMDNGQWKIRSQKAEIRNK